MFTRLFSAAVPFFLLAANPLLLGQTTLNQTREEDGTTWQLSSPLLIGSGPGQTGTVNLINGGQLLAPSHNITLGAGASTATGRVTVTGADSLLNLSSGTTLRVGEQGHGEITAADGGSLMTQTVQIAVQPGSSGEIKVEGTGSTWNTRRWLMRVGMGGNGSLLLRDGGALSNTSHIIVGDDDGAVGLIEVFGGSSLEMGIPTTSPYLRLGNSSGASGTLRIQNNSSVSGTHYTHVGTSGEGLLEMENDSVFSMRDTLHIGREAGGAGKVSVSGNSSVNVESFVYVGHLGHGELVVESGGVLHNENNFYAARQQTASGLIEVRGAGSRVSTDRDMRVAASHVLAPTGGTAEVSVEAGGLLRAGENFVVRNGATVTVGPGGKIEAEGDLDTGSGTDAGLLTLNGGELAFGGSFDATGGFSWQAGTVRARGELTGLSSVPNDGALIFEQGSLRAPGGALSVGTGASVSGYGFILSDVHLGPDSLLRGENGPLVVLGSISGDGLVENITREIRPATVINGVETSPFGTLTFSSDLNLSKVLAESEEPVFVLDLGEPDGSDRVHFENAEFRFGTHGLDLSSFSFTTHDGFTDGVYDLITSDSWLGGSLGPRTRGFVDGLPVWLRVGNDGKSIELRVGSAVDEQPFQPGEVWFGRNNYTEYRVGDLPIVLTSGHDGNLRPDEIDPRTWGVTVRDTNTLPQTLAVADEIFNRTGRRPHVVISHLHRTRLDPNREIVEAAQGNIHAEQAWSEYHEYFTQAARDASEAYAGFALVFDMHGHGHDIKRLELGYLLGRIELNVNDNTLNLPGYGWQSSLRSLVLRNPGLPFSELIRGPRSLGERFNDRGVPAWPSEEFPTIGDAPFFSGGYTTRRHACHDENSPSDAVQIESHGAVRSSAAARQSFAVDFVRILQSYVVDYYGYSLGTNAHYRLIPGQTTAARGGSSLTVAVQRSGFRSFTSTMDLEFSGTAVRGVDYTVSTQTATFASGASSSFFTIAPAAVGPEFGDRTIIIHLAPDYRQSIEGDPVVITLGDGQSQTVRVNATETVVSKDDGEAVFRLSRTIAAGALEVPLIWEGTAAAGGHYFPPDNARFEDGESSMEITVPLRADGVVEDDKTIRLRPASGPDFVTGHPAEAEIVLTDTVRPRKLAVWLTDAINGNVWQDRSGHGRHATTLPAGAGPQPQASESNRFVSLDGQSATAALPRFPADPEGAFSVAFHFRIDPSVTSVSGRHLVNYGPDGEHGSLGIYFSSNNVLRTWLAQEGLPTANALAVNSVWNTGEWWHYALTVASDGTARVYINGELSRQITFWEPPLRPNQLFWIGWEPARRNAGGFFRGDLRDFRIYQTDLTAAEVRSLAEERLTFAAWQDQFGLAAENDADPETLRRGYVFAARPDRLADPRHVNHWHDGQAGITFHRQTGASDLRYIVESSPSLLPNDWNPLAELPPGSNDWIVHANQVEVTDSHGLVDVQDNRPRTNGETRRFIRLRVEID